jgi:hypothetical protein
MLVDILGENRTQAAQAGECSILAADAPVALRKSLRDKEFLAIVFS